MRDNTGGDAEEERTGFVVRSWAKRVVGRACSVEMYIVDLDRPCGAGSCADKRRVRRSCVLPAPLGNGHQFRTEKAEGEERSGTSRQSLQSNTLLEFHHQRYGLDLHPTY